MQLQQNLQNLLSTAQNSTFRLAKLFLKENPDVLKRYVDTSVGVMGTILTQLNAFMKHLLVLQDIDLNTVPGARAQKELNDAMSASFENYHQKDYDDDYNFDWIHKRFEETQRQLRQSNLSKEKFIDLTDVSKLPGGFKNETAPFVVDGFPTINNEAQFFAHTTEVNPVSPESEKRELPLSLNTKEGRRALREKLVQDTASQLNKSQLKAEVSTFNPITDLRNALNDIEKKLGSELPISNKLGVKPGKKSANKKTPSKKIIAVSKRRGTAGATQKSNDLVNKMIASGLTSDKAENVAAQIEEVTKWDESAIQAMTRLVELSDKYNLKKGPKKEFTGSFKRSR